MHYIGVRDGKKGKLVKEGKNKSRHTGFLSHNTLGHTQFEDSGSHRSQKICDKTLIGMKQKWTNKGDDKNEEAEFSLTQYNLSYPIFVPNFKILGIVIPDTSLKEKKVYTHIFTERTKTIYPLILRMPGYKDIAQFMLMDTFCTTLSSR